jgi:hypothetical protein
VARATAAQRPHPEGTDLRAHRGAARGSDHLVARASWSAAQLGLPLRLGTRLGLALWALHALGFDEEADDFLAFLGDVTEPETSEEPASSVRRPLQVWRVPVTDSTWSQSRGTRQVLYAVDGTADIPEVELDHLSGYGGSRPVRVGNAAHAQDQFDIPWRPGRLHLPAHPIPGLIE